MTRTLFSYGIMHNHAPAVRQFLLMQGGFLNGCGLYLKSGLITIDPIERRAYQHLEYKPLVNNRAHRVGAAAPDPQRPDPRAVPAVPHGSSARRRRSTTRTSSAPPTTCSCRTGPQEALARLDAVNAGRSCRPGCSTTTSRPTRAFYRSKPAEARKIAGALRRLPGRPLARALRRRAARRPTRSRARRPAVSDDESRDQQQAAAGGQGAGARAEGRGHRGEAGLPATSPRCR